MMMIAVEHLLSSTDLERQGDRIALWEGGIPQIRTTTEEPRLDLHLDFSRYSSSNVSQLGAALDEDPKQPAPGSNADWLQTSSNASVDLEQRLLVGAGATKAITAGSNLITRVLAAYKLQRAQYEFALSLLKRTSVKPVTPETITPGIQKYIFDAAVTGAPQTYRALKGLEKRGLIRGDVATELTAQVKAIEKATTELREAKKRFPLPGKVGAKRPK